MNSCHRCQAQFEILDQDRVFYSKMDLTEPKFCPPCRLQRRLSWRNDRKLYERNCDLSGAKLISMFHPDSPVPVVDKKIWWSDEWDGRKYGREIDFNRPFFEQFEDLLKSTPLPHIMIANDENSLYTNYTFANKNCYLCFAGNHLEDSLYSYYAENSRDCVDCLFVYDSELLYECVHCNQCYNLKFSLNSRQCRDSAFLENCRNSNDCFMSWNLNGAQYYFKNKKYSKEEYERLVSDYDLSKPDHLQRALSEWNELRKDQIRPENHNVATEACSGEYLQNCKNCTDSYVMAAGGEDCRFIVNGFPGLKDSFDCSYSGEASSLMYECMASGAESYHLMFSNVCVISATHLYYCNVCFNSKNCFGSTSLRNAEYCILNRQYSKEEYEALLPRLIAHMKETGEWGEFFPSKISPFAYNESVAQDFFPLNQDAALNQGFRWAKEIAQVYREEVPSCSQCQKNFKCIPQELKFYQNRGLAVPNTCPDCRHQRRLGLKNPYYLRQRSCDSCQKEIITTESAPKPNRVFCTECYLKQVY